MGDVNRSKQSFFVPVGVGLSKTKQSIKDWGIQKKGRGTKYQTIFFIILL